MASRLIVEITETATIESPARIAKLLGRIKDQGARVAIDDFGAGHTSLRHLRAFPIDILKIDGAFVRDLGRGGSDLALVRSMSQMGQALGKVTIAEWVESEAVMAQLREVGIGCVQGYAVHVPCPLDELVDAWDTACAEPA